MKGFGQGDNSKSYPCLNFFLFKAKIFLLVLFLYKFITTGGVKIDVIFIRR